MKIGCIGQGFVGKNIADNLIERDYEVVRYSLEPEYVDNAKLISECEIVYVGVPTPTTLLGFDYSIIEDVISLTGEGSIVIIKSTILPGTTNKLQDKFTGKKIIFSPEFLCEKTAAKDVANPILNIVGLPIDNEEFKKAGEMVMSTFPKSKNCFTVSAQSAELFKYAHNLNGYFRVILANLLYEVSDKVSADWSDMKAMMDADVMMSPYYNSPSHKGGRGAGGNCFIKDMAAFRHLYRDLVAEDLAGLEVLQSLEKKNLELLEKTGKDQDLVRVVYGA